jgi:acyl-CoA synthetase (AMP-forming)/AMP-acid ligase II
MRIVREDGADAGVDEPGEIRVRGAHVMAGYWGDPEATAAAIQDGWLLTGDVGYRDAEGFLYIVDRKKDMVISGGENIYCAEVERAIQTHHDVHEVATFGLPDERLGEKLVAVVVPHPGRHVTAKEVCEWVAVHLAAYKVPANVWFQDEALPRNDLGKIDKVALRARHADRAQQGS